MSTCMICGHQYANPAIEYRRIVNDAVSLDEIEATPVCPICEMPVGVSHYRSATAEDSHIGTIPKVTP